MRSSTAAASSNNALCELLPVAPMEDLAPYPATLLMLIWISYVVSCQNGRLASPGSGPSYSDFSFVTMMGVSSTELWFSTCVFCWPTLKLKSDPRQTTLAPCGELVNRWAVDLVRYPEFIYVPQALLLPIAAPYLPPRPNSCKLTLYFSLFPCTASQCASLMFLLPGMLQSHTSNPVYTRRNWQSHTLTNPASLQNQLSFWATLGQLYCFLSGGSMHGVQLCVCMSLHGVARASRVAADPTLLILASSPLSLQPNS